MNTNNSISNSLKKLLEINTNSLKTFERINEAVTTNAKDIPLEILTDEGTKIVSIPGFGYMKKELERLDNNLKALAGLSKGTTRVKLADGTFQNIVTTSLKTPANDITTLARPTAFASKPNYFAEDFLNPMLTTSIDVSGQIPNDTERVLVKRILFDGTNQVAVDFFNENYRNQDNIDYLTAIRDIVNNNIAYTLDEELRDMPYRTTQFTGRFDVLSISNSQREVVEEGVTTKQAIKLYTLDKLTYSDNDKDLDDTELLRVGDQLMVTGGSKNTRYKISKLDASTRQVELELVEGYEAIKIGAGSLSIYKVEDNNLSIEVPVAFDERILMFVKAVDPESKILAESWSPGVGFHSNDLEVVQEDGAIILLSDFYKENVADFGRLITSIKEDNIPPATVGVTPNAPTLVADNFKVVQINKHLTENDAADKIKKLSADKATVEEAVKKLDDTITKKRSEIATKKYESQVQKDKDKSELNSLIEERTSEAKLYNSIVTQIQSLSSSSNAAKITPKYRIRGFWSVPAPKQVADTLDQNVVQFIVQYRYLSTSGKAAEVSQLKFTEEDREKAAVFSNWNEVKTKVRERAKSIDNNGNIADKFTWQDTKIEDGQEINFNQLDIAINQGELVEIRIKSVSEAGFPANPMLSDWSEPVLVSFPEEEIDTTDVAAVVEVNTAELAKVQITEELTAQGVFTHVSDAFTANENYYAHVATNIASGFLSPEQKPISVYDKIAELEAQIASLKSDVEAEVGELVVKIVAEDGTVTNIAKDTTTQLFAGYYVDEVADLTVRKGHIVTKTFKLQLENSKATKLELVSRLIGDRTKPVYRSFGSTAGDPFDNNFGVGVNDQGGTGIDVKVNRDNYYQEEGNYDLAPVQYQNVTVGSGAGAGEYAETHQAPYQSAQRRGQFIYSRYMDIANQNPHYLTAPLNPLISNTDATIEDYEYSLSFDGTGNTDPWPNPNNDTYSSANFIWDGSFTNIANNIDWSNELIKVTSTSQVGLTNYNNGLFLHKNHPFLANLWDDAQNAQNFDLETVKKSMIFSMPKSATQGTGTQLLSIFGYDLSTNEVSSKQQMAYHNGTGLFDATLAAANNNIIRPLKMSFDASDQYLLGGQSCGAFLFMSPVSVDTLKVSGETKRSAKEIKAKKDNESNAISVDIVFQYRMTDYFGNNEDTDTGRIGGLARLAFNNLTYTKKIGLDIFDKYGEQFSFDLEVFAKYSPKGKNLNSIKAARLLRPIPREIL
jgi:hypothetical protein